MTKLLWDQTGERFYETGVDHGVLYIPDNVGVYNTGFAWNGLTTVTESPSGADTTPTYADNMKYLNLVSVEDFGATVEAYTYPPEFAQCDGTAASTPGVTLGQQARKTFGLSYRTKIGNDVTGNDYGYKLHLIYNALAAPTERAYASVNDSPSAITFSWAVTTTPIPVTGYRATALLLIDSTLVNPTKLTDLETLLYGAVGAEPMLPTPEEVIANFAGSVTQVTPTIPSFASNTITIPAVTGVIYKINGVTRAAGAVAITANTIVTAVPAAGYKFPAVFDADWMYVFV